MPASPPASGSLAEWDFPGLLFHHYRRDSNGRLTIHGEDWHKEVFLANGRTCYCRSSRTEDRLDVFLRRQGALPPEPYELSNAIMRSKSCRQGRALMELGLLTPTTLWEQVRAQLRHILFSLFPLNNGTFSFDCQGYGEENILLDDHPPALIAAGIRRIDDDNLINSRIQRFPAFKIAAGNPENRQYLEDPEKYVLDLIYRFSEQRVVIETSELLPSDTRKIIYLLFCLGIIREPSDLQDAGGTAMENAAASPATFAFQSFEEALHHYNRRYKLIFKALHKELGPIACSILEKAVRDTVSGLHHAFRFAVLTKTGELERDPLLKNFWHCDFQSNIGDFLRGLEEIMYAEIHAVRNHLGREYEQQVIKWIRESDN